MSNEIHPTYDCTQQELYSKSLLAWQNCSDNLVDFTNKKPKYTALYVTGKVAAINAAKLLPEQGMRELASITEHSKLPELAKKCLDNFQDAKLYIDDVVTYPPDSIHAHYVAAGANYYRKAAHNNWEFVEGLNGMLMSFIAAETVALSANNNMPAGFEAQVILDAGNFHTAYEAFKPLSETGVATSEKIAANNGVDKDYKDLLIDGKGVFRNDATKRDLFIDEKLMAIVSPPGSASLKIGVQRSGSNENVAGAIVTMQMKGGKILTETTDVNGEVVFKSIDPGVYTGSVNVSDVITAFTKEVNTGVNARMTVTV